MVSTDIDYAVQAMARSIFIDCGAESDYCVQYRGENVLIFGGTNRLKLTRYGWTIDPSYCTPRFIELFNEKYGRQS